MRSGRSTKIRACASAARRLWSSNRRSGAHGSSIRGRRLPARARAALLRRRWFRDGVRDISSRRDPIVTHWLETFLPRLPVLQAESWSVRATSWVDSYHRELNRLRPGHAHDGQFYLADQRLPSTPVVGLANIDHAQPVLGGHGLDAARLWRALAACAWHEAGG